MDGGSEWCALAGCSELPRGMVVLPPHDGSDGGGDGDVTIAYAAGCEVFVYKRRAMRCVGHVAMPPTAAPPAELRCLAVATCAPRAHFLLCADAHGNVAAAAVALPACGATVLVVPGAGAPVQALAVAPGGRWMAVAAGDALDVYEIDMPAAAVARRDAHADRPLRAPRSSPTCVALAPLPGAPDVLAVLVGATDGRLHLLLHRSGALRPVGVLEGHADWLLDVAARPLGRRAVAVASAAADASVRVWLLRETGKGSASASASASASGAAFSAGAVRFAVGSRAYELVLHAVLRGHEDAVWSVDWLPGEVAPLSLLSASRDRSVLLWAPAAAAAAAAADDAAGDAADLDATGAWTVAARLGDVGGNVLGFYGARWGPAGNFVAAHGYGGALRLWKRRRCDGLYEPAAVASGHARAVVDVAWDRDETALLFSASADRSVRAWVPQMDGWVEVARPIVHGYDLLAIEPLPGRRLAVASDEKAVRVLEAPVAFVRSLDNLVGGGTVPRVTRAGAPFGAVTQAMGLSNIPVFEDAAGSMASAAAAAELLAAADGGGDDDGDEGGGAVDVRELPVAAVPRVLTEPPPEEFLRHSSQWPELRALYGHNHSVSCLAAANAAPLLASASAGARSEGVEVIVWDTETWARVAELRPHQSTVTQMAFSPCDRMLLTVSRDRSWALARRCVDGSSSFETVCAITAHDRMVLGCAWAPVDALFATAGRDKRLRLWRLRADLSGADPAGVIAAPAAVHAVAFAPAESGIHLAYGTVAGAIFLVRVAGGAPEPLPRAMCPLGAITRLRFRVVSGQLALAVASEDHSVRLLRIEK